MKTIRYVIEKGYITATSSSAMVDPDEDLGEAVLADAWQTIWIDVNITIGGTTMFAAAWSDPEHWSDDWAEKLGCSNGDVPEQVAALLAEAVVA